MRRNLTVEDLGDFIEQPRIAIMSTHFKDGSTLLSPVGYLWHHGAFLIAMPADDIKARHIARSPEVSVCVAEQAPPYRGVEVRGRAELLDEQDNLLELARTITQRYLGEQRGDRYVRSSKSNSSGRLVIRVAPGRLRVWDFTDDANVISEQ